ncbi:outer membrane protein transport protein [Pedobacter sp. SD-b]|uniref:Outer membrane protein transport protein n=1 Tax=Pedobacter segetis TaxID=2793069 RepID=A0ABS1BMC2_9SPHI|nr:outer membrane protein transport protein [Pedobacter segetis]MBK0384047.1 outer membrane protein transport protein [Pedobacter segetis]
MRFKKILSVAFIVIAAKTSYAQYTEDALRFSQFQNSNTARFDALGGSKTAIGGDLSSLYGNPAGLGMFSKSEFSLTPSLKLRNNDISISNLSGNSTNNTSSNLDLNNVGVVFNTKTYKSKDLDKGLVSLSFGIGYQKRGSFRNDFNYGGKTNANGLGDFFAQTASAENRPQNNLNNVNGAAYDSFLINEDGSSTNYAAITSIKSDQLQTVNRTGGNSSVDFSLGANISNKLFLGAAIGLASFRYSSIETTNETGLYRQPNTTNDFNYNVDYTRNFDTQGTGINLKLGAILRPTNELRLGVSLESPTWFSVTDNYSETLYNNIDPIEGTVNYPFEYKLRTPLKVNGGLAYFFGKNGFLSADIGYEDFSTINFSSSDSNQDFKSNKEIKTEYKNVINYSLGGELRVTDNLLLRAGFQSQANPYKNLNNKDYTINSYSAGFGYRFGTYYLDLAYINSKNPLSYNNYQLTGGNAPLANITTKRNNVSLTFGVRF